MPDGRSVRMPFPCARRARDPLSQTELLHWTVGLAGGGGATGGRCGIDLLSRGERLRVRSGIARDGGGCLARSHPTRTHSGAVLIVFFRHNNLASLCLPEANLANIV